MGSLRKKSFTKPLPQSAELFTKKGEQFARWQDQNGQKRTAPVTVGRNGDQRIVFRSATYTAKYRDAAGSVKEVSTKCRDKQAAAAVLAELEREADRERAGIVTSKESASLVSSSRPLSDHLDSYTSARKAKGLAERHVRETRELIEKVCRECGFNTLASVQRHKVEEWLAVLAESGTGARRRNIYLEAIRAFLRWCVAGNRLLTDPLKDIARADQDADVRFERRALMDVELQNLLNAARLRPLAEFGRETVQLPPDKSKRSCWMYAPLTLGNISRAAERAKEKLADKALFIEEKLLLGWERSLIYKTLALTGLRRGELAAVEIRNVFLDESQPYIKLDRRSEKNREGNTIPLRVDLADDLRMWIHDKAMKVEETSRNAPSVNFEVEAAQIRRSDHTATAPAARLPGKEKLFAVPERRAMLRIIDRDYAVAGIEKVDDRGRKVDIHSLRHSFATWIGESGISPKAAQKLMRHSDVNLTMRYTHGRPEAETKALDALPAAELNSERQMHNAATGTGSLAPMLSPESVHGSLKSRSVSLSDNLHDSPGRSHGRHPATKKAENCGNSAAFGSDDE
ncbi:MAG: site-specific integrase, partial [Planctomycetota bacterium]|nr:site-specific integrase [Planctomycetota bacterium]